jgi:neuralized-like protein 4
MRQLLQVRSSYGANLERLHAGSTVGLLLDEESRLHLYIDGLDQGVAASDLPAYVYAVIDLYGQCEQISIINTSSESTNLTPLVNDNEMLNDTNNATVCAMERLAIEADDVENSREKADLECHEKESGSAMHVDELTDGLSAIVVQEKSGSNEVKTELEEGNLSTTVTKNNDLASRNSLSSHKGMRKFNLFIKIIYSMKY